MFATLDLIVNPDVRDTFKSVPNHVADCWTPGSGTKPRLHTQKEVPSEAFRDVPINSMMNLTRIATELHFKRLVVGGFERVYELGRIFRNEKYFDLTQSRVYIC
jgi:lysyl-tRNA synthetase class 2